eukprot:123931-Hanusia_phi.AAC.2
MDVMFFTVNGQLIGYASAASQQPRSSRDKTSDVQSLRYRPPQLSCIILKHDLFPLSHFSLSSPHELVEICCVIKHDHENKSANIFGAMFFNFAPQKFLYKDNLKNVWSSLRQKTLGLAMTGVCKSLAR